MNPRVFPIVLVAAAAIPIGVLWVFDLPLGIPGEWTWTRIEASEALLVILGAVQAVCLYTVFALVAWAGSRRVGTAGRLEVTGWISGLVIVGFGWLHAVQEAPAPEGMNLGRIPFVMYYPSSSGYFFQARYEVEELSGFLRDYESIVRQGDVLHGGTHPPGLIICFRMLMSLRETLPSLAVLPEWVLTQSAEESFGIISEQTAGTPHMLTGQDRTVIWMAAMLTQLAAASVVVPLFVLLRLTLDPAAAWRIVCFWPFVPAVGVFLPKSDVLFAPVACLLVCLWMYAVRAGSHRAAASPDQGGAADRRPGNGQMPIGNPLVLGALAGVAGWLGLFCSLVFLPVGVIAVVASALMFRRTPARGGKSGDASHADRLILQFIRPLAGGAVAFITLTVAVASVWHLNLPRVWLLNYANHARFYEVSPRSYFGWLLVNPVELVLALGTPLVVILLTGCCQRETRQQPAETLWQKVWRPENGAAVSVAVVWGLLWLSGKNSGEVARLWIPLMPLAIWAGASCRLNIWRDCAEGATSKVTWRWMTALSLQAVVCLATNLRVSGFLQELKLL